MSAIDRRRTTRRSRSSLLTNARRGTLNLSAWCQTVSDCGWTPATPQNTTTAPSSTRRRALDLDREVDVARGVDQVDLVLLPLERGRGRGDRDAALALLLHPVHLGLAVVDLADLVDLAGVEQEPLRDGGLAGVDVGDDAEVADHVDLRHKARAGIAQNGESGGALRYAPRHACGHLGRADRSPGRRRAGRARRATPSRHRHPRRRTSPARRRSTRRPSRRCRDGRHLDAVRDYGAAYDITRDPVLFYKIGSANERAGRCDVAQIYYGRYLEQARPGEAFVALTRERIRACGGDDRNLGGAPAPSSPTPAPGAAAGAGSAEPAEPAEPAVAQPAVAEPTPAVEPAAGSAASAAGAMGLPPGRDRAAWLLVTGSVALATVGAVLAYSANTAERDVQRPLRRLRGPAPDVRRAHPADLRRAGRRGRALRAAVVDRRSGSPARPRSARRSCSGAARPTTSCRSRRRCRATAAVSAPSSGSDHPRRSRPGRRVQRGRARAARCRPSARCPCRSRSGRAASSRPRASPRTRRSRRAGARARTPSRPSRIPSSSGGRSGRSDDGSGRCGQFSTPRCASAARSRLTAWPVRISKPTAASRVDVGAHVDLLADALLGRHHRRRALGLAGDRQVRLRARPSRSRSRRPSRRPASRPARSRS